MNRLFLNQDLKVLQKMLDNHQLFTERLESTTLQHHERQMIQAAIVGLTEMISIKTRDVQRRLR